MSISYEEYHSDNSFLSDDHTSYKAEDEYEKIAQLVHPDLISLEMDETNEASSHVSVLNDPVDLLPPHPGAGRGTMPAIEEESKSYDTSASVTSLSRPVVQEQIASSREDSMKSLQEDAELSETKELEDLKQLINDIESPNQVVLTLGLGQGGVSNVHDGSPSSNNISSNSNEGLNALLSKFERLESAENILEEFLNSGVPEGVDINAIINQLPLFDGLINNIENGEDFAQRSTSSEIASIQKIIDDIGNVEVAGTVEVAGGNSLLGLVSSSKDRDITDVLKEYDELERSISRSSVIDESFRSEISDLPQLSSYSTKPEKVIKTVPVIKPPVIQSTKSASFSTNTTSSAPVPATSIPDKSHNDRVTKTQEMFREFELGDQDLISVKNNRTNTSRLPNHNDNRGPVQALRSSRVESSHSASVIRSNPNHQHGGVRPTTSSSTTSTPITTSREYDQSSFKPRHRKPMRSPRTMISPRQDTFGDMPTSASIGGGGGEGYRFLQQGMSNNQEKSDYAVAEALKTIEKLNSMVARQEVMMETYSQDNKKLWSQLKDSKTEYEEKEKNFEDVINSLKTEVATLKLNRLVTSNSSSLSPRQANVNKVEVQRLREDSEVKSKQLMELRKEILYLQTKLSEQSRFAPKQRQPLVPVGVAQEKEKDYQNKINSLNKQVRTLQKILYNKEPVAQQNSSNVSQTQPKTSKPMQRTKSDISKQNAASNKQHSLVKHVQNSGVNTTGILPGRIGGIGVAQNNIRSVNINTGEVLQASLSLLDHEREEFENIVSEKNRLLFEKEKTILNLKDQIESLKGQLPDGEVVEHGLTDELRSYIISQNKVIQTLKAHLSANKKLENDNVILREEKNALEHQLQDQRRKLEHARNVGKPENEVLSALSEKVDELNSRYYQRERQLATLLNTLTIKTSSGGCVGSASATNLRLSLDQFRNNNSTLGDSLPRGRSSTLIPADILHMADFSPSSSFNLLNTISDLPQM